MKCLYAMYELDKPFAKAAMRGSFRAAPFAEQLQN